MTARKSPAPKFVAPTGTYLGRLDGDVVRATGIRYATSERFAAPVALPDSTAEFDATQWSPRCPQVPDPLADLLNEGLGVTLREDESAQYLSVTMPTKSAHGLPVLVWIHGGSYVTGAGDAPIYDPRKLVAEQNLIVVNVTYRLGVFGFLGDEQRSANLGLLDQIEALRWVQRNISAFGGDPEQVTVCGESAGGDAVWHLLATDAARGLFRRAIVHSAPLGLRRGRATMNAVMLARARELPEDAPAADLVAAQTRITAKLGRHGLRSGMPFGVQYGYAPMPPEADISTAWRAGAHEVDLLIGSNTREAALFVHAKPGVSRLAVRPAVAKVTEPLIRTLTQTIYTKDVEKSARVYAKAGGTAYAYRCDWGAEPFRGSHAVELPLLFGAPAWRSSAFLEGVTDEQLQTEGAEFRRVWAEFVRTGVAPKPRVDFLRIRAVHDEVSETIFGEQA